MNKGLNTTTEYDIIVKKMNKEIINQTTKYRVGKV